MEIIIDVYREDLTCHCIQFKYNIAHTNTVVIPLKRKGGKSGFFPIIAWKK